MIYTVTYLFNGTDSPHAEVVGVATTLEKAQEIMKADFEEKKRNHEGTGDTDLESIKPLLAKIVINDYYFDWTIQEFDLSLNQDKIKEREITCNRVASILNDYDSKNDTSELPSIGAISIEVEEMGHEMKNLIHNQNTYE